MDSIETVLNSGSTSPTDFTLHDGEHGFRVAEKMVEIIPDDVLPQLSEYELALLLLSAYLHDIGMTPKKNRVAAYYQYLLTGQKEDSLSEEERCEFEIWLDGNHCGIRPPLSENELSGATLGDAEYFITHFCREKHNDWSADWIKKHLAQKKLGTYQHWLYDLIRLCQSHHFDHEKLLGPAFDPRHVDADSSVVHLRYLAIVLRIADVLDIDPERTPEVVMQQRNVSFSSLLYWYKDHAIALRLEDKQYALSASPKQALIHKAVEDTAQQIAQELQLCNNIVLEKPLDYLPGSNKRLPHKWEIKPNLQSRITPYSESYVYINGSFRPDTKQLLKLLSGIELYGDNLAAVRELLQNAFDAVRERIARHRLEESSDPVLLSKLYAVELKVEKSKNEFWLICKDQGAGMNKQIINNHLLVSGASRRTDLLTLSRRCETAGFHLERTAKFGIGVLSYFMLSDYIAINTKRCQIAGDSETHGWTFSTEGLGAFGELRKNSNCTTGTEVRLRLRPEVASSLEEVESYWTKILKYLKKTLSNIPCRFFAQSKLFPEGSLKYQQAGWVRSPQEYSSVSFPTLAPISFPEMYRDGPADILPVKKLSIRDSLREQTEKREQIAQQALHWTEPISDTLPGKLGEYRFLIPYFKLPRGNCFHFMYISEKESYLTLNTVKNQDRLFFAPKCPLTMSWFGIHVEYDEKQFSWPGEVLLEIDWKSENAGTIEVNRNKIILQDNTLEALNEVYETIKRRSYGRMA